MKLNHLLIFLMTPGTVVAAELTPWLQIAAKGEAGYTAVRSQPHGLRPWWQEGTGQLAPSASEWRLGPQLASLKITPDSDFSATINTQFSQIPDEEFGVIEAWLHYTPLPIDGYRLRARAGWFYPSLSLENNDTAWSSSYSSSFSAINSWFAEELRSQGLELTLQRPGNAFNANYSLSLVGAVVRGNDPIGSVISWRGFAIHSAQTNLGQQFKFANYPSLAVPPLHLQPNVVDPFIEVDDRFGYYAGVHWLWQQDTEVRAYYYDNNAEPTAFAKQQYAWHTTFAHLAWQHQFNAQWRVLGQWLSGSTEMGMETVYVDYDAWFLLANYQQDDWQFSVRYDDWQQQDNDITPLDPNDGEGHGLTLSVQYALTPHISTQLEWVLLDTTQQSRAQWPTWPITRTFGQSSVLVQWRF